MKKSTILLVLFFATSFVNAQVEGCDGERYADYVFTDVDVTYNVVYGEATTLGGNNQILEMDIYQPVGDELENRPVIVFAHGGGFIGGTRADMAVICNDYARRGYVTATISYRLLDAIVFDSTAFTEEIVLATSDMKAAVRYFREDADNDDTYKADPNNIIAGGISAGAVMACQVGFIDEGDELPPYIQNHIDAHGGLQGESSDNTEYSSSVQGVINWSGGLARVDWLDSGDPAFYSAHDDMDAVVPCTYDTSDLFFFPLYIYGTCEMAPRADDQGVPHNEYYVEDSEEHVSYFYNETEYALVINQTATFLYDLLCGELSVDESNSSELEISIYPFPSIGEMNIKNLPINEKSYFSLYDIQGKILINQALIENKRFDLGYLNLSEGSYIVKITNEQGAMLYSNSMPIKN